jgi:UDP-2,3-diacylglucosamine pyrophosphatase LpxH
MNQELRNEKIMMTITLAVGFALLASTARAHCDTMNGPVVTEAKAALEKGDVTTILKWIKKDNEAEIKAVFAKTVAVRAKGPEAKELADQYFMETLVRLHRAGEDAPYTGIKDEPVEPIVAMADKALADGSADEMIKKMTGHMAAAIKDKFIKALEAKKHKEKNIATGREFVEAYVIYMHYVEGLHAAIMLSGGHHHKEAAEGEAGHQEHGE